MVSRGFGLFQEKLICKGKGRRMHLFETDEGDIWICINCGREQETEIKEKGWEYIFDKDDPTLRCHLCKGPDYEVED